MRGWSQTDDKNRPAHATIRGRSPPQRWQRLPRFICSIFIEGPPLSFTTSGVLIRGEIGMYLVAIVIGGLIMAFALYGLASFIHDLLRH
jgi:hypothetical protein